MTNTMLILIGFYLDWKLGLALIGLKLIELLWFLRKQAVIEKEFQALMKDWKK